jgi:heme-binding NEAT domain protein
MRGNLTKHIFGSSAAFVLVVAGVCGFGSAQRVAPASSSPSQSSAQAAPPSAQSPSPASGTPQGVDPKSGDKTTGDSGADTGDIPRIRVGTNEVNVVFTVTDKHGKRVTDLKQGDFRIVDDNKSGRRFEVFTRRQICRCR